MQRVKRRTGDDWSLVSILARWGPRHSEIEALARVQLEADCFSGFVLRQRRALSQAQAPCARSVRNTTSTPALDQRLQAVTSAGPMPAAGAASSRSRSAPSQAAPPAWRCRTRAWVMHRLGRSRRPAVAAARGKRRSVSCVIGLMAAPHGGGTGLDHRRVRLFRAAHVNADSPWALCGRRITPSHLQGAGHFRLGDARHVRSNRQRRGRQKTVGGSSAELDKRWRRRSPPATPSRWDNSPAPSRRRGHGRSQAPRTETPPVRGPERA
jgi:hypothetical protein